MKLSVVNAIVNILAGMKISRIEDKEAKAVLLKEYLAARRFAKEAMDEKDEIIRKFQDDWADELPKVEAFRSQGKPVIGHLDYLEAERDANKAISDVFQREVDIDIVPVKTDAITGVSGVSENITLEDIAFLVDIGMLEE